MADFDSREKIGGLICTTSSIGGIHDKHYEVKFKREHATMKQIESISWKRPPVNDFCKLPKGFAFDMVGLTYNSADGYYTVKLRVRDQYLGDVTRYQEEIAGKDATIAEKDETIAAKESTITSLNSQLAEADETILTMSDQLAEADEAMLALYEQMETGSSKG